jgi:hypothetical protein
MGSVHARGDTFLTFVLKALTETNTSRLATDIYIYIYIYIYTHTHTYIHVHDDYDVDLPCEVKQCTSWLCIAISSSTKTLRLQRSTYKLRTSSKASINMTTNNSISLKAVTKLTCSYQVAGMLIMTVVTLLLCSYFVPKIERGQWPAFISTEQWCTVRMIYNIHVLLTDNCLQIAFLDNMTPP